MVVIDLVTFLMNKQSIFSHIFMDIETMSDHLEHQYKNNPPTPQKMHFSIQVPGQVCLCLSGNVCECEQTLWIGPS